MPRVPSRSPARIAIAIGVAVLLTSCGDPYGATNPYDPDYPVTFTITGPDTLFNLGEAAVFTVSTVPVFPDTAFRWAVAAVTLTTPAGEDTVVDGATILEPGAPGSFTSVAPPLYPEVATVVVAALVGSVDTTLQRFIDSNYVTIRTVEPRHVGHKTVMVTQRLVRIQLRCPTTHACDPLSVADTASVWVDGVDAHGLQISALRSPRTNPLTGPPIATYVIRDTTIATFVPAGVRSATVTAVRTGTTWIVATRGALSDSLQIVVH
jgi:hypothetical protein